ncbi:hypothetical protein JOD63_001078 [Microbacterium terrae]|uniref:DUF4349 domain-containing protein n=1 Tax=Microbacterium terrae TaxID=69369 RepID=A0A0M2H3L8_9MICO|nr:DUF4349 domain-containing protein [Microbacterium terrae]KJL38950.1 hypothetical protein RS81_02360 [Microbacterium terrae]MBP1077110.1 hypothetical protein [Microbacterium terrae]GLJ99704.1 hypothetical protein GCM10017594_29020 [Microbacterium terrae]
MNATQNPPLEASLPELDDARIDAIEDAVFADIARERASETTRRTRRGRLWMGGAAAAAVIAVAAVIAPAVTGLVTGTSSGSDSAAVAPAMEPGVAPDSATDFTGSEESAGRDDAGAMSEPADGMAGRDIITTASASVVVADTAAAAEAVGDAATAAGGYVESMNVDTTATTSAPIEGDGVVSDTYPYPYPGSGAWITVRVPADALPDVVADLGEVGEVTASSITRQDVSQQTVDLQARVDASQASVDRLTELMGEAGDLSDLIAAEAALAERQATLEAYQMELERLDDQVAMSTLTVSLVAETDPVEADPAGFTDGLEAGWNGLVATLNGIVIALGFLLPWLAVAAAAALIVWGVVRLRRRRRTAVAPPTDDAD